jgi:cytoskeletal protein RodZ
MTGFGGALRAERERCGQTLESLSDQTKVSVLHLQALEAEQYGALPNGVFRRGFVRAYVTALGLEESHWMERFQISHDAYARAAGVTAPQPEAWETFAENVKRGRVKERRKFDLRWLLLFGLVLGLLGGAWAAWHYVLQNRLH